MTSHKLTHKQLSSIAHSIALVRPWADDSDTNHLLWQMSRAHIIDALSLYDPLFPRDLFLRWTEEERERSDLQNA